MRLMVVWLASILTLFGQAAGPSQDWEVRMKQGEALSRGGEYRQALAVFQQALKIASEADSQPAHLAYALNGLAMAYDELAQPSQAEPLYRRALAVLERAGNKGNSDYAAILANLAGSSTVAGQMVKAESLLRESIEIHLHAPVPDPVNLALARNCFAKLLMQRGELEEAEPAIDYAIKTFEQFPQAKAQLGMAINNRGALLSHRRRYDEAAESFERALSLLESSLGSRHPLLAQTLTNLGTVYRLAGRYAEARNRLERAQSIAAEKLGQEHPVYGVVLQSYAELLKKTGHKNDAKKVQAQAQAIVAGNARRNGSAMTVDISALRAK